MTMKRKRLSCGLAVSLTSALAIAGDCPVCTWHPPGLEETCHGACENGFAFFNTPGFYQCEGEGSELVCHQNENPTEVHRTYSHASNPSAPCGSCSWVKVAEYTIDVYECWHDDTDCNDG